MTPYVFSKHFVVFLLLGLFSSLVSAMEWTIKDLGVLPGATYSRGHALNDLGQVAGIVDLDPSHTSIGDLNGIGRAFLSGPNGGPLSLVEKNSPQSRLYAFGVLEVNDLGQVVGYAHQGSSLIWGYTSSPNGGVLKNLELFGRGVDINDAGTALYDGTEGAGGAVVFNNDGTRQVISEGPPRGINNDGQIVFESAVKTSDNNNWTGAIWSETSGFRPIEIAGSATRLYDINDAGQALGLRAGVNNEFFVVDPDGAVHFVSLPGDLIVSPFIFNDRNISIDDFLRNPNSFPKLNEDGQIIGRMQTAGGETFSFLASLNSSDVINLNTETDIVNAGWTNLIVSDINNHGQITGTGFIDGKLRAFLLTPVPEPETYAMMLAGLSMLGFVRRRKTHQV